jgi:catalase
LSRAKIFPEIGKKTAQFIWSSSIAGESGALNAERYCRGLSLKFYTAEG